MDDGRAGEEWKLWKKRHIEEGETGVKDKKGVTKMRYSLSACGHL